MRALAVLLISVQVFIVYTANVQEPSHLYNLCLFLQRVTQEGFLWDASA